MPTDGSPELLDARRPPAVALALAAVAGLLALCASDLGVAASPLPAAPPGAAAVASVVPAHVTPAEDDVGRQVRVTRVGAVTDGSRIVLAIRRDGRPVASCSGRELRICRHTLREGDVGRRFTGTVATRGERGWTYTDAPLTLEAAR